MQYTVLYNVFVQLLYLTSHGLTGVLAELQPPTNVRINSVNMGLVLEWNASENQTENMTYRAEYRSLIGSFKAVCFNTTAPSCDFTPHLNPLGVYVFQVRAEQDGDTSPWVKTKEFVMDEQTILGPPSVTLVSTGTEIEVNIQDPVFRIRRFRDVYNHAIFRITYWIEGQEEKVLELEPLSKYCISVMVLTQRFFKHSQPSNVTCEGTAEANYLVNPWLLAFLVFVMIALVIGGMVLVVWLCYRLVRFLGTKAHLPEHFTEHMLDKRCSSFLAMHKSPPPDEVYHEVIICSAGRETLFPLKK
ncbi:interleukin-10 receptor subunit beta isoform X2 [Esox lucius]|uniref:interleukin-10 receptor subunit beta isoform X2 n=1 Tax=Esox lucius TaxID=8010 RepID=UPI000577EF39|nr:interleukin-10 receptor subunit beta isoform X2 [Esox lucius]